MHWMPAQQVCQLPVDMSVDPLASSADGLPFRLLFKMLDGTGTWGGLIARADPHFF